MQYVGICFMPCLLVYFFHSIESPALSTCNLRERKFSLTLSAVHIERHRKKGTNKNAMRLSVTQGLQCYYCKAAADELPRLRSPGRYFPLSRIYSRRIDFHACVLSAKLHFPGGSTLEMCKLALLWRLDSSYMPVYILYNLRYEFIKTLRYFGASFS